MAASSIHLHLVEYDPVRGDMVTAALLVGRTAQAKEGTATM